MMKDQVFESDSEQQEAIDRLRMKVKNMHMTQM